MHSGRLCKAKDPALEKLALTAADGMSNLSPRKASLKGALSNAKYAAQLAESHLQSSLPGLVCTFHLNQHKKLRSSAGEALFEIHLSKPRSPGKTLSWSRSLTVSFGTQICGLSFTPER